MAEADGRQLGVRIRRSDRRPYHELYRERFPVRAAASPASPRQEHVNAGFGRRLKRPFSLIIAGSAGERVQTAAAILCKAAVLSGLHCVQKNDYPVTVGSGFSLSEVKLSPEPIVYTGIDAPDAIIIASADGLREVRTRGDLARLAPGGLVIIDESVASDIVGEQVLSVPLRRALTPDTAAFGAIAALNARAGLVEEDALVAAIGALGGEDASLRRAVATVATLRSECAGPRA
jgi:2-oxoglutarate/2-oxoacid ferredoxin oxidoreductase subunit beta